MQRVSRGDFMAELELVLLKLSAIDLCQARCVCREWRRAIDAPSFREGYARSHGCIPHLSLRLAESLFVKPVDNSPRSEWRLFQTLPEGMTIASTDAGLLCLATFGDLDRPSSIYVWRYSDINSSPVRVPLPPVPIDWSRMVVYTRDRDRSTPQFRVAIFDRPSLAFYVYDSALSQWSVHGDLYPSGRRGDPDMGCTIHNNGFYPMLHHGVAVILCTETWRVLRYNMWDGSWSIADLDTTELELGSRWAFVLLDPGRLFVLSEDDNTEDLEGLIVAEMQGEKWQVASCCDDLGDVELCEDLICTDGSNSIWLVDSDCSRIMHFGVVSKCWSEVETPDTFQGHKELAWFSC
ncbi:uncharacterized protein LOC112342417 [Selaginella moellendorffii]|uniref:uncharacterized protein LOC112342417 n=1 Tax=Selaginella moellendorffii TaxID=88036 RepID=UPI000D1C8E18|nr:uncharacterized protein LOC112342417 [Selaginella moellendorffii]|eukprot:XP_024519971.1 uncharacterized protein LOC112342417 [Selaginella moellendorffii]